MITFLAIVVLFIAIVFLYMRLPKFGANPSGERLSNMQNSPRYSSGKFANTNYTPQITEGYSMSQVLYEFIFKKTQGRSPVNVVPSVKNDLLKYPLDKDILVWFGHSSYYIQIGEIRLLIDPVFSGNASPIPGTNKSFRGSDIYSVDDLPDIDYLIITHDHYDHLDYKTIKSLLGKVNRVICGLGVGAHLEFWGFNNEFIIERDWYETIELDNNILLHTLPARHFSGRGFKRCNTLWMSFLLQTPNMKIYLGGDSGYDTHFSEIGNQFGPIDLALLDNGQYDAKWRYIHALPEEVMQAAIDLKTIRLMPIHSAKFVLANHTWDEPLKRITELSIEHNLPMVTPMIGEIVNLSDIKNEYIRWWEDVR